jgi:hypothetical protein
VQLTAVNCNAVFKQINVETEKENLDWQNLTFLIREGAIAIFTAKNPGITGRAIPHKEQSSRYVDHCTTSICRKAITRVMFLERVVW